MMSTYLYLQKYRNTMYSKIKNYTTMFTKYTLPLGPICTSPLVCFEWYVCDIYIFILRFLPPLPRRSVQTKSRVPLLFYFDISCKDGGDFPLHESPWYVGANQGTFLSAWTVHFTRGTLLLNAFPRAREAELVRGHGRALNKVCVLQTLVAQRAAQRYAARYRGVWNALGVHLVHAHLWGARTGRLSLRQPPLVHGGRRQRAAAVPPGGGVDLVTVLGGAVPTSVVCRHDERRHGGLAVLGLRWGGTGVRGYRGGGRCEAWWRNWRHFGSLGGRR